MPRVNQFRPMRWGAVIWLPETSVLLILATTGTCGNARLNAAARMKWKLPGTKMTSGQRALAAAAMGLPRNSRERGERGHSGERIWTAAPAGARARIGPSLAPARMVTARPAAIQAAA